MPRLPRLHDREKIKDDIYTVELKVSGDSCQDVIAKEKVKIQTDGAFRLPYRVGKKINYVEVQTDEKGATVNDARIDGSSDSACDFYIGQYAKQH